MGLRLKAALQSFSLMFLYRHALTYLNNSRCFHKSYPAFRGSSGTVCILGYSEVVVVGGGLGALRACGLTMTWMTKSF